MLPNIRTNHVPYLVQIGYVLVGEVIVVAVTATHVLVDPVQVDAEKLQQIALSDQEEFIALMSIVGGVPLLNLHYKHRHWN